MPAFALPHRPWFRKVSAQLLPSRSKASRPPGRSIYLQISRERKLLDADTTPSIRLLSLVFEGLKPGQTLKWVPWQLRLSARQYQERIEARSSRAIKSELQLLRHAFFDDAPGVPVENHALSAGWLQRIQTVFRNALALCQAAHLSNLKAFDKKVADLCLTQPCPPTGSSGPIRADAYAK